MVIEDSFEVGAEPPTVFAYLLDVEKVVTCMPGAELIDVVDATTFKARVKIKVGPIVTSYIGTGGIVARDDVARSATLRVQGDETVGAGSARASITMVVQAATTGSIVRITTDYSIVGRVAQFGRGVMEDVSRRLTAQMAECIRQRLEAPTDTGATVQASVIPDQSPDHAAVAEPLSGSRLLFAVLLGRLRRLFGR